MEKTPKSKTKKTLWFILIDIALACVILAICLVLLKHKPAEYDPPSFTLTASRQVSPYLTSEIAARFFNGVQANKPFTMEFTQAGINESIQSLGWPQMYEGIIFSTPVVKFHDDHLLAMGRVNFSGVDTVLTVEFKPFFDEQGRLNLQISKIKSGAINITYFAKKAARKVYNDQFSTIKVNPDDIIENIIGSILADKPFTPAFKWDKRYFKVDKVQLKEQKALISFVPAR